MANLGQGGMRANQNFDKLWFGDIFGGVRRKKVKKLALAVLVKRERTRPV